MAASNVAIEESPQARSNAIDRQIELDRKHRLKRNEQELGLLLLGPSGAGKSTFVRQLRLAYDRDGLTVEKHAFRLVIILSIVQSVAALLNVLEPVSIIDDDREAYIEKASRLAVVLNLETALREQLGVIATGPSTASLAAHAAQNEGVEKAAYSKFPSALPSPNPSIMTTDTRLSDDGRESRPFAPIHQKQEALRRAAARGRTLSPGALMFGPRLAEKVGSAVQSISKRSMRGSRADSIYGDDWKPALDDPIHTILSSRDDIAALWQQATSMGLVAGRGPKTHQAGGVELAESAPYFLDNLTAIGSAQWLPSDQDMLHVRVRTLGVETHHLQVKSGLAYKISDVAGARGTKHVWAPFFSDAAAITFVASLSDYCEANPSNPHHNRLNDCLDLFQDIVENPILRSTTMILFLNKTDLLHEKVRSGLHPLSRYLEGYSGDVTSFSQSLRYLRELFEERNTRYSHPLYIHHTMLIDSKTCQFTLDAVNDILMRKSLVEASLL